VTLLCRTGPWHLRSKYGLFSFLSVCSCCWCFNLLLLSLMEPISVMVTCHGHGIFILATHPEGKFTFCMTCSSWVRRSMLHNVLCSASNSLWWACLNLKRQHSQLCANWLRYSFVTLCQKWQLYALHLFFWKILTEFSSVCWLGDMPVWYHGTYLLLSLAHCKTKLAMTDFYGEKYRDCNRDIRAARFCGLMTA
jgi:hypothetical protein